MNRQYPKATVSTLNVMDKHKQQRPIPYKAPESSMLHCNSQSVDIQYRDTITFNIVSFMIVLCAKLYKKIKCKKQKLKSL